MSDVSSKDGGTESPRTWQVTAVDVDDVRPLRQRYLRPGQPPEAVHYESDKNASSTHHAVHDERGVVLGIASLVRNNRVAGVGPYRTPGVRIRGVAVDDAYRRKGMGRAIVSALFEAAKDSGANEVWANAREGSFEFFAATGFTNVSSEFDCPGLGKHIVMARPILRPRETPKKPATESATDEIA